MAKPLIVVVPHQLGRQEARRRIETGLEQLKQTFGGQFTSIEQAWTGDRLDVRIAAVGQTISATIDIAESEVRVDVQLPWMLAILADKAKGLIRKEGTLLLDKK